MASTACESGRMRWRLPFKARRAFRHVWLVLLLGIVIVDQRGICSARLDMAAAHAAAAHRGGMCLSSKYVNTRTPMQWKCGKGHEWQTTLDRVRRGFWCPHCAGNARLTLSHARQLATQKGGACLSRRYVNCRVPLTWRCREGHEWKTSFRVVRQGSWCPKCALQGGSQRLSLTDAQDAARKRAGICLSTNYLNCMKHLRWRCKKGHEWDARLKTIRNQGCWCPHCAVESQRLSLRDAQDAAVARGGTCLSSKYINCKKYLQWRCRKGHEWRASLNSIRNQGAWCPDCAVEARRLSLKVAQQAACDRGGTLLSTSYVHSEERLKWKCSKGHEWAATLRNVRHKNSWCPKCAIEARSLSLEDAQAEAASRGGVLLSMEYVKCQTPLTWRCGKGHEWSAPLIRIRKRGSWCPKCAVEAHHLSLKDAQGVATASGGKLLSKEYVNNKKPLRWRCSRGHEWSASLSSVKNQGSWCPVCAVEATRLSLEDAQELAAARGGRLLSQEYSNSQTHLKWMCLKGHVWSASLGNVRNGGTWCPECALEGRRLSLEDAQKLASTRGGTLLSSNYVNSQQHLEWRCKKGHVWLACLGSVRNSRSWCPKCAADAQRFSIEDAQNEAAARGGEVLSREYVNSQKHLKWRCTKGHEWSASLSSVRNRGSWCAKCAFEAQRLSLEDAQVVAEVRGGTLLSQTYIGSQKHLKWKCHRGHEWFASLSSIRSAGTWCPKCALETKRLSLEDAQKAATSRGGKLLSTKYVNCQKRLRWICSKGHQWSASLSSVRNKGSWCPECFIEAQRLPLEAAQAAAIRRGGVLLSWEYVNSQKHLEWKCPDGHVWSASLSSVKNAGTWCPECAIDAQRLSLNDAQEEAAARGGTLISTEYINSQTRLKWRCSKGHEWAAPLSNVKHGGTWCPECASGKSEGEVRSILENRIFPGKSFRKCRPKFLSTPRGGRLELDGFSKELRIAFEYQGEQHYKPDSYFHRGRRRSFENMVARDRLKIARCKEAGVKLLIVPYFEKDPEALLRRLLGLSRDEGMTQEGPSS